MKKTILGLTSLFIASSAIAAGSTGQGVVNFKGTIVQAACGIAPEFADQTIDFGQLSSIHLNGGGVSQSKDVVIKVVNCTLNDAGSTNNTIQVAFSGVTTVPGELSTTGTTGAVILMNSATGNVLFDGSNGPIQKFNAGNNTLRYSAVVKKGVNTITEGQFSAVTNFTLSYN